MSVHSWSIIEIGDDGSTTRTRTLSTGGVVVIQHVPNENADQNGMVTESITVLFEANGGDTGVEIAQDVRSYIEQGQRYYEQREGGRAYLVFSRLDESETWRSPIAGGLIDWQADALQGYSSGMVPGVIVIQRENFWERHDAEVQLADGVSITNDGASYVSLAAPDGDAPAPLRVELTNTGSGTSTREFYASLCSNALPTGSAYTLAGDTESWTDAQTHLLLYMTEDFGTGELGKLSGEKYYILVGLSSQTGNFYIQGNVYTKIGASYVPRSSTPETYVDGEGIIVLGPVRIPPTGTGKTTGGISLAFTVRSDAGSHGFTAEWVQLMAAPLRTLTQTGYSWGSNDIIVDDGVSGFAYMYDNSESYRVPIIEAEGQPLQVLPGKASVLRVVWAEGDDVDDTQTADVDVYYRPRRRTL